MSLKSSPAHSKSQPLRTIEKLRKFNGIAKPNNNLSTDRLGEYTLLQDTRYKGLEKPEIAGKKREDLLGRGDYSKKLQYLMKGAEYYNKSLKDLQRFAITRIREAEGMYPERGQYENVENSGFINSPITSLYQADALSTPDRINYGLKDRKTGKHTIVGDMFHDHGSHRLGMERASEGGDHGPRKQFIQKFTRTLGSHLKNYSEIDRLRKRDDPISKLLLTQMENIHKRIDYLTDDKKLQDLTGIDFDDNYTKQKFFVNRLLPSPLSKTGKTSTWARKPDNALAKAFDPKSSDFFAYTAPFVLDSPLGYYMDKKTKEISRPAEDFLQPFRSVSDLARHTVLGQRNKMTEFCQMNPEVMDQRIIDEYLDCPRIFTKGVRETPVGINGLGNFTDMRGDASGGLQNYRPIGMDLIEQHSHGQTMKPLDYKPFLNQLYKSTSNKTMLSRTSPQPFKPDLPLPQADLGIKQYQKILDS